MPLLGLGTWKSKPGVVGNAVKTAIDCGYKHIDCAAIYGNEKEIGDALKEKIDTVDKRKDLFVTSKLWNTKHGAKDVRPAFMKTLKDLQLDYLDLYLIHWPIGFKAGNDPFPKNADGSIMYSDVHPLETWQEMEKLVDEGLVRSIGLSNFNSKQVAEIMTKGRIKPSILQIECHPYLNQEDLIKFCKDNEVIVTAYSPLGSPDRPWAKAGEPLLLEDEKIIGIAKKYNKTAAQVCIRFQIERGISVIPKSTSANRIKENSEVFDFSLKPEDMAVIKSFQRPWRACIPMAEVDGKRVPRDAGHPHFPFHEAF